MRHAISLLLLGSLLMVAARAGSEPAASPWTVDFAGPRGVSIRYRGIPIIRQSTLYAVKPGWTGLVYDQRSQQHRVERTGAGLHVVGQNHDFRAEYTLEPLDDRRCRLHFEGQLLEDVPANLEYAIGYLNANLIANRPFRAELPSGGKIGVVPAWPSSEQQERNELVPGFRSVEFESRIGRLRLEASAPQPLRFFDARRDPQDWAKTAPVFWVGMGANEGNLKFGKPVKVDLLLTVEPAPQAELRARVVQAAPVPVAVAQSAQRSSDLLVIPQPKQLRRTAGAYRLANGVEWSMSAPSGEARITPAVRALLHDRLGLSPARGTRSRSKSSWTEIRLGKPAAAHSDTAELWARNPEGYRLLVTRDGITISAPTAQGAFYGLQTLEQLLKPVGSGFECPGVEVKDWPSMRFRGAHWFPSASGVPFHRKLIQRIMARYKLNRAVIQCEGAKWDSHPEIAAPNSVSKLDLRGLVQLCRANYIEPIPLVNCPGHGEWMFRNGQNLQFAEDPKTPYAYCVNNPESDRFIKQILGEAIDVFHPRTFHLGHDEVTLKGRFPNPECPRCAGKSVTELMLQDTRRLHRWLHQQHIGTMIWGDMLLAHNEVPDAGLAPNPLEAFTRRTGLPKGVTVADWHYGGSQVYPSLDLFKQAGLDAVGCTWYEPLNIQRFAQAVKRAGSPGILQTTWCGYFPDEKVLRSESRQFSAFILAAEYAWSGRNDLPTALPYDAGTEFTRAYRGESVRQRPGALIDLSPAAIVSRRDWTGLGPGWDLGALPSGDQRFGDVLFRIPGERVAVIGGGGTVPDASGELMVELGHTARQVALLNAVAWGVPGGTAAARLTVEYADGTQTTKELTVGESTASWTGETPAIEAPIAWRTKSPGDTPLSLRVTRWDNPHPERAIARLRFQPLEPEAAWVLAGLTLLQ